MDVFNLGLLYKWKWRFLNDKGALLVKIVKFFHGEGGGFSEDSRIGIGGGVWQKIVGSINHLHENGCIPSNYMYRVVGDETQTRF